MLFNSLNFFLFLAIVFVIYWFPLSKKYKWQNFFILIASYVFYAWWDWRFLSLIVTSSLADFLIGLKLSSTSEKTNRKVLLITSLLLNLGLLAYFKYANFFIASLANALSTIGISANLPTLHIILPVGISFYTFQTLSYTIDIYRKEIKPTSDPIAFMAYVSFFPQLVAGPIERAKNLLPTFLKPRKLEIKNIEDGARQILWGLFKKIVIADNCAVIVNEIFANHASYAGLTLLLGAMFFAFQIYGDFSGYSDIACGTAKLLGFKLMINFNYPYFTSNLSEFWKKWHISLSSWVDNYLFTPLSLSFRTLGKIGLVTAFLLSFGLVGLWHGASWNFVVFGLIHGIGLSFLATSRKTRKKLSKSLPSQSYNIISKITTFTFWSLSLIFFRAKDLGTALDLTKSIFLNINKYMGQPLLFLKAPITSFILAMLLLEWLQRHKEHPLDISFLPLLIRRTSYLILSLAIIFFGNFSKNTFIYFQF